MVVVAFNFIIVIRVACNKIWQQVRICWACCFIVGVTDGGVDITLGEGLNAVGFQPIWILGTVIAATVGHVGIKDNSIAGALTKLCLFSVVVPIVLKVGILRFLVSIAVVVVVAVVVAAVVVVVAVVVAIVVVVVAILVVVAFVVVVAIHLWLLVLVALVLLILGVSHPLDLPEKFFLVFFDSCIDGSGI